MTSSDPTTGFQDSAPESAVRFFPDGRLLVADWEGGKIGWRVVEGETQTHFNREQMLSGEVWGGQPCTLIIEHAHLHERRPLSDSQVYTRSELERLYETALRDQVTILAFPQRLSLRARKENGFQSKTDDPYAIAAFHLARPEVALKRWSPVSDAKHALYDAANEMRMDMTVRLNVMRPDYLPDNPDVVHAKELLYRVYDRLSDGTRAHFGLAKKRDGTFKKTDLKWSQVMSLYVAVYDENQQLRRNPQGDFIGCEFIWGHLLLMSPFHGRSGTARSNLMHHGLKHYDKSRKYDYTDTPEEHAARRETWARWRRETKELLKAFRDA